MRLRIKRGRAEMFVMGLHAMDSSVRTKFRRHTVSRELKDHVEKVGTRKETIDTAKDKVKDAGVYSNF